MSSKVIDNLSVYIPILNEEKNIKLTLSKLTLFQSVYLIDSGSLDNTKAISKEFKNVTVIDTTLSSYFDKLKFATNHCKKDYIMLIDADYVLNEKLVKSILKLNIDRNIHGYSSKIYFQINKTIIREKIYPSKTFLFKNIYNYSEIGHKECLNIPENKIKILQGEIYHDDKKDFSYWFRSQINIANKESDYIVYSKTKNLKKTLRKIPFFSVFVAFFYFAFFKKVIIYLPGGMVFLAQRIIYETILNYYVLKKILINSPSR